MEAKSVLITGTGPGGIGFELVRAFHDRGFFVFATDWNSDSVTHLAGLSYVEFLALDITSPNAIAKAAEKIKPKLEDRGLNVLVSNAGRGYITPIVDFNLDKGGALFEVNVWGTLSVVKAFWPMVRSAKGTIVNIASVGGELHTPWIGK